MKETGTPKALDAIADKSSCLPTETKDKVGEETQEAPREKSRKKGATLSQVNCSSHFTKTNRRTEISTPTPTADQSQTKLPFPAWHLRNGVINASDGELEGAASSCETWAKWCGAAIVLGLIIEVGLAAKHPPFDSFIGIWGSVIADSLVAIGVFGELLFSAMGSKRLGELQRRSKLMVAELNTQAREANARAAEADRARAELEVKLQPRSLNQEQWDLIQGLRGKLPSVNIASETDAETCWFAGQIRDAFVCGSISWHVSPRRRCP